MKKTVFYLLIFLVIFSASAFAEQVKKIDVHGLKSIEQDELLDMLNIQVGTVFNPVSVRKGIKLAFLKGIFEDISVELDDKDRSHVVVTVKERDVIKKISVEGNELLSGKTVKRLFSLKEGQFMRYDLIEKSIKELNQKLAEAGFSRAEAALQAIKTEKPYQVNLILTIKEGMPDIITSIRIFGPAEDVIPLLSIKEGDVYDQNKLRKDMERIRQHYKERNYLNPSVGPFSFNNGELAIDVNPGRVIKISFEGNDSISSKILIKELPFFDAEDFREDLVDEAVSRITALYHKSGYPFAQIAPVITSDEDIITMRFFIYEGDEVFVDNILFSGITVNVKRLKEIMSLQESGFYNPDLLDSDIATITEFYNALGYLNAKVDDVQVKIQSLKADVTLTITEGIRISIESVEVKGSVLVAKEEIIKVIKIKPGDPYNEVDISDARYSIIELYSKYGFAGTKVDIKQEPVNGKGVKVVFQINERPLSFFGNTVVSGNVDTKYEVIKRELLYKEGSNFNYSLVNKTRQRLYRLGLFSDVDIETVDREDTVRDLHIKVKEGNAGLVEFGVGYSDYELYRASLDISYRNLFGMNRQISFRNEFSSLEKRFIVNYLEPWSFGQAMPFRMLFIREFKTEKNIETKEIRYKLDRYTASAGFEKKLTDNLAAEIFYEFTLVKTYDLQPDVILTKEDSGTLLISGVRPGIAYDTRDNPFDPRKGVLAGITLKAASGMLFSETDFIKAIFSLSAYKELSRRFVLAVALKSGLANGFDQTRELPLIERFFLGGRTTVRGYSQDMLGPKGVNGSPTGGNAFILENIELRTSLTKSIGIVTFLDGGFVWQKTSDINLSDMRYTAGLGLRYNTPVGPFRLDYGHKLNREKDESPGEFHFSIGHAF